VSGKRVLVGVIVLVVALVVIRGMMIVGSPSEERTRQLDLRRIDHLQRISRLVEAYHTRSQQLPASLAERDVATVLEFDDIGLDPVTRQPYPYRVLSPTRYELCATFDRASSDARTDYFWAHGAGQQCFTVNIKPSE
jgi:hypothetical protein